MRRVGGGLFNEYGKKEKSVILSVAKNLFSHADKSRFFAALSMNQN
jgi:hypothetical protein